MDLFLRLARPKGVMRGTTPWRVARGWLGWGHPQVPRFSSPEISAPPQASSTYFSCWIRVTSPVSPVIAADAPPARRRKNLTGVIMTYFFFLLYLNLLYLFLLEKLGNKSRS